MAYKRNILRLMDRSVLAQSKFLMQNNPRKREDARDVFTSYLVAFRTYLGPKLSKLLGDDIKKFELLDEVAREEPGKRGYGGYSLKKKRLSAQYLNDILSLLVSAVEHLGLSEIELKKYDDKRTMA